MTIKQIFDEIANEPGTNAKMDIMRKYVNNETLQRVLYLANSKRIKFYIKQIPEQGTKNTKLNDLSFILSELGHLSNRDVTGDDARRFLKGLLESVSEDDAYIIERIIEKDCKIGMGTTNMNKIFKGLIEETPYMGAKSYDIDLAKKIFDKKGYGYSDVKMDGRYCNAIVRSGDVELESRGGEPSILTGAQFLNELSKFKDCVLNGELTIPGISRYESNGIIASLISIGKKTLEGKDTKKEISKFVKENNMSYEQALNSIQYTVWDTITVDEYFDAASDTPYYQRRARVVELLKDAGSTKVVLIESREVKTYEEAMSHFQEVLKSGEEGTILKSANGKWKDGKPNWQVKMKLEMDVDLKIVGFNYGTKGTKNEHLISSFTCESSDGKVITRPQGLKEDMMDYVTKNQDKLMGTILECKSCGLSHDSNGNYSLLHPAFIRLRDDKNTCDSLESIIQIEAMVKGLVS